MKLSDIRQEVQKISEAIASVLNMDVIISDNEFKKIGDTKKHFDEEVKIIKDTYVIGKVVKSGKPVVISGMEESENCIVCDEKGKCKLKAMICNPIKYNNQAIGAIGLIAISEEYKKILLENQVNLIEFLDRMGDLIVSKLMEKEASNKLEVIKNQLLSIMDSIDEGVIAADENGYIVYTNSVINDALGLTPEESMKKRIYDVLPQSYVKKLVKENKQFSNIEISINKNNNDLHALISGKTVQLGAKSAGSILTFRKMDDVYKVINEMSLSNVTTSFDDIIGNSEEIVKVKDKAKMVANSNSTILILGESGTGKELFARAIHESSNRKNKPFIAFNCAAIPENLIESELFGYEEGAFTGAVRGGKPGKFQLAQGGTIFLDEIGDMPLHLQTKLLRVLQEKSIEKIGGHKSIPIDTRVIAATNKELDKMAEAGEFREDLYYRLNVIPINIPPLRERKGDIKIILEYLLKVYNKKLNKNIKGFSSNVESVLLNNKWKGNVRELENVVEYSVNMETTSYITMNSIPQKILDTEGVAARHVSIVPIQEMEEKLIKQALMVYGDSVTGKAMAAEALNISMATLYRKIKEYNL
ncbi:MAG: sigma 54-interacting transcriptional regulator [Sedimentibacter saalensis]|uniref:sigma 54-interacting transcriptional regulator n=1 Tax=Sedimentibacter saalensis TaxID=130788 RepID=UPI002B21812F|nr:sigma 54-interacting transcriptional regulator [Sedimentibacter saalensis]MEA5096311.1 sigma 54-interacting transcriptional regulator [Sedimentibacter saalensis]